MLLRRLALLLLISCNADAAGIANIGAEYFGPGTKAQMITMEQAVEMALQNNLDSKIEHVGIGVEEARRRGKCENQEHTGDSVDHRTCRRVA